MCSESGVSDATELPEVDIDTLALKLRTIAPDMLGMTGATGLDDLWQAHRLQTTASNKI